MSSSMRCCTQSALFTNTRGQTGINSWTYTSRILPRVVLLFNSIVTTLTNGLLRTGKADQFDVNTFRSYFHDYHLQYDIHSVMHYPEKSFSKDNLNTIVAKNGQRLGCLHLKQCPTLLDIQKINTVYNCSKNRERVVYSRKIAQQTHT